MNYKVIFTILALCICLTVPAMAVGQFYESKIAPSPSEVTVLTGVLSGAVRCGYNTLTKEIGIKNDADINGEYKFFPILPDGRFGEMIGDDEYKYDIELIPGNFTLYIKAPNGGGADQYSHVTIVVNQKSFPEKELLGYAVTQADKEISAPAPTPTIQPDCHTHRIYIPGHYELKQTCDRHNHCHTNWEWVSGYWYTWECCEHHCNS